MLFIIWHGQTESESACHKLQIFSDCKLALQALQNPQRQNGQSVLKRIVEKLEAIRVARGLEVQFQWIAARSELEGDEEADTLARSATVEGVSTPPAMVCMASGPLSKVKKDSA